MIQKLCAWTVAYFYMIPSFLIFNLFVSISIFLNINRVYSVENKIVCLESRAIKQDHYYHQHYNFSPQPAVSVRPVWRFLEVIPYANLVSWWHAVTSNPCLLDSTKYRWWCYIERDPFALGRFVTQTRWWSRVLFTTYRFAGPLWCGTVIALPVSVVNNRIHTAHRKRCHNQSHAGSSVLIIIIIIRPLRVSFGLRSRRNPGRCERYDVVRSIL